MSESSPRPWRTGRKVHRTLYNARDELIGVMDRREDAALVVEAVNGEQGRLAARVEAANAQLVAQAERIGHLEAECSRMEQRDFFDKKALFEETRERCAQLAASLPEAEGTYSRRPIDVAREIAAAIRAMEFEP